MDKPTTQSNIGREPMSACGLFVRGRIISTLASIIKKKDGSRLVKVSHEIAIEPGVLKLDRFFEAKSAEVKIDGENVVEFPRLAHYEPISLRVLAHRIFREEFIITKAEILP